MRTTSNPLVFVVPVLGSLMASIAFAQADIYALEGRVQREPNNVQIRLQLGKEYSRRYDDDRSSTDAQKAQEHLDFAAKLAPGSVEVKARKAALLCLEAREKNSKNKARSGLKQLDTLIQQDPNNPLARQLRGFVGVEVPAEFERGDQALADLVTVEEMIRRDGSLVAKYDLNVTKIYLKLGKAYRAKGDIAQARKWWQQAVATGGATKEAQTAQRLLNKSR